MVETAAFAAPLSRPKTKNGFSRKALEAFVYEVIDGQPIYYRGYREALRNHQTSESIMGSSKKQSYLVNLILRFFGKVLDLKKYDTAVSEPGVQLGKGSYVSNDIIIYGAEFRDRMFTNTYFDFPPKIVVEVDTKAELRDLEWGNDYYHKKTIRLLDFGVEKVVWVFTNVRKIQVAERGKPWLVMDWAQTVHILPGCDLNLKSLLDEVGVDMDEKFPRILD